MTTSITIWRLGPQLLDQDATLPAARLAALLTPEEQQRAQSFFHEEDRHVYLTAHAALRILLARRLGLAPASIPIAAEGGAKPALVRVTPSLPDLRFNLSHTRRGILIAIASAIELGIDLELHRPLEEMESLAQTILSPADLAQWLTLPQALRLPAFYNLWTRKEACLKAMGIGLYRDPRSIPAPVTPEPLPRPILIEDKIDNQPTTHWQLADLPVWPGFSAALCWQPSAAPARLEINDLTLADLTFV